MKKSIFIVLAIICLPLIGVAQSSITLDITGHDAKCNGSTTGSAKVIPSGGVIPYSYLWTPGAASSDSVSGLAAGTYSVTVTDHNGNKASTFIIIAQPTPLTDSIGADIVRPCFMGTLGGAVCGCANTLWAIVSGGTPPYSYLWSPGGGTDDTLHDACYIEFTVTVTDINNCVTTDSINVTQPITGGGGTTGVAQVNSTSAINTYPNPANSLLNISLGSSAANVSGIAVYNMTGQKIIQQHLSGSQHNIAIDVSGLANGDYLLSITSDGPQQTAHFSVLR